MYRQTGDPKATAELLMHSETSQMMNRYTISGVAPRLGLAVKAFDASPSGIVAVQRGSTPRKRKKS